MKDYDEYSTDDRPYLGTLKGLLEKGDERSLKNFIINYETNGLFDDEYMEELKSLAYYDDIDTIEDMILSYNDYVDNFKFDDDSDDYEEDLYNCMSGSDGLCEDEMLSDDNSIASELNFEFDDLEKIESEFDEL